MSLLSEGKSSFFPTESDEQWNCFEGNSWKNVWEKGQSFSEHVETILEMDWAELSQGIKCKRNKTKKGANPELSQPIIANHAIPWADLVGAWQTFRLALNLLANLLKVCVDLVFCVQELGPLFGSDHLCQCEQNNRYQEQCSPLLRHSYSHQNQADPKNGMVFDQGFIYQKRYREKFPEVSKGLIRIQGGLLTTSEFYCTVCYLN